MRKLFFAAAGLIAFGALSSAANANVLVRVSKSRQMMYVYVDGYLEHSWPVSTGRGGYGTPGGVYHPTSLDRFHRSSRYHNSPMPYSIFFRGGYANSRFLRGRQSRTASLTWVHQAPSLPCKRTLRPRARLWFRRNKDCCFAVIHP